MGGTWGLVIRNSFGQLDSGENIRKTESGERGKAERSNEKERGGKDNRLHSKLFSFGHSYPNSARPKSALGHGSSNGRNLLCPWLSVQLICTGRVGLEFGRAHAVTFGCHGAITCN